jgi:hypothetical protein
MRFPLLLRLKKQVVKGLPFEIRKLFLMPLREVEYEDQEAVPF